MYNVHFLSGFGGVSLGLVTTEKELPTRVPRPPGGGRSKATTPPPQQRNNSLRGVDPPPSNVRTPLGGADPPPRNVGAFKVTPPPPSTVRKIQVQGRVVGD